jgi:hypothetical protein
MSGRYEVYMESVSGRGERVRISTSGGFWPRWSRDGKELFYVAPDEQLMAVGLSVRSRGEMPQPGAPAALFRTRFARGGNVTRAGNVAKAQYSVAADGRFLMNVAADPPTPHPIMVVFNWQSAHGARERR